MTGGDALYDALHALTEGNPSFDQILWDSTRHVLSFRRAGQDAHVNLWLHRGTALEHVVERNGGPGGIPEILWQDGKWQSETAPRGRFLFLLPGDIADSVGDTHVTVDRLPLDPATGADPTP